MKQWSSVDEALDYAIAREADAAAFYQKLAGNAEHAWMAKTFEQFSKEELGHKAKLEGVKAGKTLHASEKKVLDLKIGDYLVDVDPNEKLDYQGALIVAMKREKASFKLYSDLAQTTTDAGLRDTFLALAQEEAKHKLRFEVEYDNEVLKEN